MCIRDRIKPLTGEGIVAGSGSEYCPRRTSLCLDFLLSELKPAHVRASFLDPMQIRTRSVSGKHLAFGPSSPGSSSCQRVLTKTIQPFLRRRVRGAVLYQSQVLSRISGLSASLRSLTRSSSNAPCARLPVTPPPT